MNEEFEELKNQLIVDEEEFPKDRLNPLMEILVEFTRITKEGKIILVKQVPSRKVLPLILSARFIAHKLNKEIPDIVSKDELLSYSFLKNNVFNTRLGELIRDGTANKENNSFKIKNIFIAEGFLKELKDKSKKFLIKPNKQRLRQGTLKTDEKIKEEQFKLNGDKDFPSLSEFLKKCKCRTFREKTLIIAKYIILIKKDNIFSEGEILYAYKNLGIQKPQAFHQMFLDIKKEKRWIIETGEEIFLWKITQQGEDYIKENLIENG